MAPRIEFETIRTEIPLSQPHDQLRIDRLSARHDQLAYFGRIGYDLASTITVPCEEIAIIVDTLQRADE